MSKNVVFSQPWGGLGDNIQYSNLPRLYNSIGKNFYISRFNFVRSKEVEELCWSSNEYVKSGKKIIPTIGYKVGIENNFKLLDEKFSTIQNVNKLHGFDPGDGYPELQIKKTDFVTAKKYDVVIDINGFSLFNHTTISYDKNSFREVISKYSSKNTFELSYPNLYKEKLFRNEHKKLEVKNLYHLIEILLQTDKFVCVNSGAHTLAATLKNISGSPKEIISFNSVSDPDIEIVNGSINEKAGGFYFDNVFYEYIDVVNNPTPDNNLNHKRDTRGVADQMQKSIFIHQFIFNPVSMTRDLIIQNASKIYHNIRKALNIEK